MKTYLEAIQYVIVDLTSGVKRYRFNTWPMVEIIAEIYGIDAETVTRDIQNNIDDFYKKQKQEQRMLRRADHEQRRQAFLTKLL